MKQARFDYDKELLDLGDLAVEPTYDEQVKPERYNRKFWYHSLLAQRSSQNWERQERCRMFLPEGRGLGEEDD